MFRMVFILGGVALAILSPAPLALDLELAEEFPVEWTCRGSFRNPPDLTCFSRCNYYDGEQGRSQVTWRCPNSDNLAACSRSPCKTQEDCDKYGLPYTPCHDVEYFVCEARAVRETQLGCKVKGPPGSAVKIGDCVLRVVFNRRAGGIMQVRMDCWNPSDYAFAWDGWKPTHPETLVRFPSPRPPRPSDYKPLE